jgi:hypothetical protein
LIEEIRKALHASVVAEDKSPESKIPYKMKKLQEYFNPEASSIAE